MASSGQCDDGDHPKNPASDENGGDDDRASSSSGKEERSPSPPPPPSSSGTTTPPVDRCAAAASRRRRSSSQTTTTVDISKKQTSLRSLVRTDRESHTADIGALDRFLGKLSMQIRSRGDPPFHPRFWSYVRSTLESCGRPVGFRGASSSSDGDGPDVVVGVVPKGPNDASAFYGKYLEMSPFKPINPAAVAKGSGISIVLVLTELFYATKLGMVSMEFAPECSRCGGAVTLAERLSSLPSVANCKACQQENKLHSLDLVSLVFFFHPSILYCLERNIGCAAPSKKSMENTVICAPVPATPTGSGFRYSLGCGPEELRMGPPVPAGRYWMKCSISNTDAWFVVRRDATDDDEPAVVRYRVSELEFRGDPETHDPKVIEVPHGKIHFDVIPDTKSLTMLWLRRDVGQDALMRVPKCERQPYTSAGAVLNHPTFTKLFSEQQVLNVTSFLEVRRVVLVFTDVVGSTNLYATLGDGKALELVKSHYEVLFEEFSSRGRVVKTVGDAVMASFVTGSDAIEAVAGALSKVGDRCPRPDGRPFEIRVGIHAGSAVVVPLNGINDYFGQSVNVAARVEAAAPASGCLVTEDVFGYDSDAIVVYEELVKNGTISGFSEIPNVELELKGVEGTVKARGFRSSSTVRDPPKIGTRFERVFGGALAGSLKVCRDNLAEEVLVRSDRNAPKLKPLQRLSLAEEVAVSRDGRASTPKPLQRLSLDVNLLQKASP